MPEEPVILTCKMANVPFCSLRKRLGCSLDTLVAIEKLDPPCDLKNWKTVRYPSSHQNLPSVGTNENLFCNYNDETILLRFLNYSKKRCQSVRRSASVLTERQSDENDKPTTIVRRSASMCSTRDSNADRGNSWAKIAKGHYGQIRDHVENHPSAKAHILHPSSTYGAFGNNNGNNGWPIHSRTNQSTKFLDAKCKTNELAGPAKRNLDDNDSPSVLGTRSSATQQQELSSSCASLPSIGASRNNVSVHARLKMTKEHLQELGTMRTLQEHRMREVKLMVGRWQDRHKVVCKPENLVQAHSRSRETCDITTWRPLPKINENLVNNTTRSEAPTKEPNDYLCCEDSGYYSNSNNVTNDDDRGYHSNESLGGDELMPSRSASPTTTMCSSTEIIKDIGTEYEVEKNKILNDNNASAKNANHLTRAKTPVSSASTTTVVESPKTAIGKLDVKSPILSSLLNRSKSVYYGSPGRSKLEKTSYAAPRGRFVQTAV